MPASHPHAGVPGRARGERDLLPLLLGLQGPQRGGSAHRRVVRPGLHFPAGLGGKHLGHLPAGAAAAPAARRQLPRPQPLLCRPALHHRHPLHRRCALDRVLGAGRRRLPHALLRGEPQRHRRHPLPLGRQPGARRQHRPAAPRRPPPPQGAGRRPPPHLGLRRPRHPPALLLLHRGAAARRRRGEGERRRGGRAGGRPRSSGLGAGPGRWAPGESGRREAGAGPHGEG